jgi:hypothetical protein
MAAGVKHLLYQVEEARRPPCVNSNPAKDASPEWDTVPFELALFETDAPAGEPTVQ